MRLKKTLLILTAAFMVAVLGTLFFYYLVVVDRVMEYEMELKVTEPGHMAFNVGTDKIYFSKVPPGSSGRRTLEVRGAEERDMKVKFEAFGELGEWIELEDNYFVIPKNITRNVTIVATVPYNATPGVNVTGTLRGTFLRYWR